MAGSKLVSPVYATAVVWRSRVALDRGIVTADPRISHQMARMVRMIAARLTGPDVLTVARGALAGAAGFAAVWLALASSDAPGRLAVAVALGVAAVADGLDGWWARRLALTSERGARLDTIADLALAAAMLAALIGLVSAVPAWLWIACGAIVALRGAVATIMWARCRRLAITHTVANKAAGVFATVAVLVAIARGEAEPFTAVAACIVAALAAVDELVYAARCKRWDANAGGFWRA